MKKILLVLLALTVILCFAACGRQNEDGTFPTSFTEGEKQVNIDTAYAKIHKLVEDNDPMDIRSDSLSTIYGIDEDLVKKALGISFTVPDAAFPGEAIMIEAPDKESAEKVAAAIKAHRDGILTQSKSYDKITYNLVSECDVITQGNTVGFFFSDKHEDMEKYFKGEK